MKQWYEKLFTNYANSYDKEIFTQGTIAEVDFIENEIGHDTSKKIIDIGCGTGRHAVELARRGYSVTGIDLSDSQLARAREKAAIAGVNVTFLKKDARDFHFDEPFDAAIMLCEGAFSLMETDEMNYQILANAEKVLKPGGLFIFSCLNALFPLYHSVKDFINQNTVDDHLESVENSFDLMTFRDHSTLTITDDNGKKKTITCNERYYTPSEIHWLLRSLNFSTIDVLGCETGAFRRNKELSTDDYEMLVIARK
ncbi:MAG: class I SAM-dependent methyltransferase [Candidatus Marinimicrobia bacterium]|nr:class I SAM-dependent methyltransferase [Candidatus Neomarinimicrobiota bacterium]